MTRRSGLWFDPEAAPEYTRTIDVDLSAIATSVAGPRRPQDLVVSLDDVPALFRREPVRSRDEPDLPAFPVAIASITS